MNQEKCEKRPVIGAVICNDIIEYQAEEQESDTDQREEKRAGKRIEPGDPVYIGVLIENTVQEDPAGGYNQGYRD
jgi:hypothetical protein